MKAFVTVVLFCFFLVSFAQPSNKFELIDVFDIEYVSDPQISPNGEKIVYVRNFKDIMTDNNLSNIWIINYDGTENRPLTTGNQKDFYPRWSKDGTKIIYKSDKDGSVQIYLRWIESNLETKLTNVQSAPNEISWSSDGNYLAFNMFVPKDIPIVLKLPSKPEDAKWNDPPKYIDQFIYRTNDQGYLADGKLQLFIIPKDGGTPRQITSSYFDHGAPIWSKEGDRLYFTANLEKDSEFNPSNSEIYSIKIQSGEIDTLTNQQGTDSNPVISPDGKYIAYLRFNSTFPPNQITKLYVMDIDGANKRLISGEFDRDVQNIQWDNKGDGLYFQYDDQGNTKIAYMNLSGNVTDLTSNVGGLSLGRPYSGGSFTISPKGKYAFTLSTPEHPADLASGELSTTKRLTDLNKDLFEYKNLGNIEELWFKSSYDNHDIQGWVLLPPGFNPDLKYPLILEIHGGPYENYGYRFSAEMQLYAASGYIVLYVNPRGSTSYGQEFCDLIGQHNMEGLYQDLMSGVDAVIKKGFVDENNLFVTGGSYGGYLTAWIVGNTSRFNAAVAAKPVINQYSISLYSDISIWVISWFGDYPWKIPDQYLSRSPISLIENITTPTMILTGEQDYRCPIADSEQFYTALKLKKVDAALVRIPNSNHQIASKPSNLIVKVTAVLTWFEKYSIDSDINE